MHYELVDIYDVMRTTFAARTFTDDPLPDDVVERILDNARFAPSGGNRQGWKVVVVVDADQRRRLRDLYLPGWYEYLAMRRAGLVPFAPLTDRAAEAEALEAVEGIAQRAAAHPDFAEQLDQVPVLAVVLADLRALAATDRDAPRYGFVGGASVYPFCWSILLAARAHGLAGVMTTMLVRREPEVLAAVGAPQGWAVAAGLALGYPAQPPPTQLRREAVEDFTTVDRVDGRRFRGGAADPPAGR